MKTASLLVGLSVIAAGFTGTAAYAAPGLVDVYIGNCSWVNAITSDVPPNPLTIYHPTVHPTCTGSTTVSLTNDPAFTFNDTAGTASSPEIDVTGATSGISCSYKVTNATFNRQGTTRNYTGGPFTATLTGGSFLCPSTETVNPVTLIFH